MLLIGAAILLSGRYQLATDSRTGAILRLDRITGTIRICLPAKNHPLSLDCTGWADDWVSVPTN